VFAAILNRIAWLAMPPAVVCQIDAQNSAAFGKALDSGWKSARDRCRSPPTGLGGHASRVGNPEVRAAGKNMRKNPSVLDTVGGRSMLE
jgi:hypothetical protein